MLALSSTDKFCCFGIFVFVFVFNFFVLVLDFVNKFVIFSFFAIFVFVFVNENHTGSCSACFQRSMLRTLAMCEAYVSARAQVDCWPPVAKTARSTCGHLISRIASWSVSLLHSCFAGKFHNSMPSIPV